MKQLLSDLLIWLVAWLGVYAVEVHHLQLDDRVMLECDWLEHCWSLDVDGTGRDCAAEQDQT